MAVLSAVAYDTRTSCACAGESVTRNAPSAFEPVFSITLVAEMLSDPAPGVSSSRIVPVATARAIVAPTGLDSVKRNVSSDSGMLSPTISTVTITLV